MISAALFVGSLLPVVAFADEEMPLKISTENQAEISDAITDLITENESSTAAVSVVVFDDEKEICSIIYGDADRENAIHADENTVFEWGSVSKLLVWTSAMQLYEQGKLDLNADIRTYLPDGYLKHLTYDEPITMLDLMNHSAGFLSPYKDMETDDVTAIMPLDEALSKIAPAQQYAPGKSVAYSNYGAALAGYVVQCVSGMDYADYVNENIFDRLGMEHTAICPDLSDNEWVAEQRGNIKCYAQGDGELISLGECRRYIHIYPAGGACGTISDMAIFARAFLQEDSSLFEKDSTLREMLSPTLYYGDEKTPRFCHGFMTTIAGTTLVGHGGNTEGFSSALQLDLDNKTGFVMMTNKQLDRVYKGSLPKALYGKPDHTSISENSFTKLDLSGHYKMNGGTFDKGCFKVFGLFSDSFTVSEAGDKYTGTRGVKSIEQISDTALLVQLVTGDEYIYFIRTKDGKVEVLENGSLDFIKVSTTGYYLEWAILILMIAGMVVMILLTIINAIRLRKFKDTDAYSFKKAQLFAGIFAAAVALFILLLSQFGVASMPMRAVASIAISLFTVALAASTILCIKIKPEHKNTVMIAVQSVSCLFIIIGVVFWDLWRFWGF